MHSSPRSGKSSLLGLCLKSLVFLLRLTTPELSGKHWISREKSGCENPPGLLKGNKLIDTVTAYHPWKPTNERKHKTKLFLVFWHGGFVCQTHSFLLLSYFFRFNWTATPWSFSWKWLVWCCFFADYDLVTLIWTYKEVNAVLQKRTYSNSGCNIPFPSLAPLSRRNFFTPVLPPQIYLSTGGVLDPICFEHPKHFFSLYCSRVFQLFWISFGGESCIFQVFPHGGEKDIIDEFCRRYSLLLFDVSNHSKVPPLDFITLFTQSFSDLWGR